ncbi:MAG TPA: carbohydrate ABC transporter permease [Acidimicrobiia bacterium]|nr:carbohydrate ABC transporter permease [Acidimicrobiia bacterium]
MTAETPTLTPTASQPLDLPAGARPITPMQKVIHFLSRGIVQFVMVVVALFWLMPIAGLLITSIREPQLYGVSGWWNAITAPSQFTLENYASLIGDASLIESVLATFYIAIPATVLPVFLAAMAGYALALIDFKGRDALFLVVIGMLVVPLQMALIPAFTLFRTLGLSGLPSIWLFHTAFGLPLAIFLMRNYFAGLPPSLIEAARIDGASEWTIFRKIILPLGYPAIAALTIFQFTWAWNDLLVALVFATDQQPITLFLRDRLGEFSSGIGVISPGVFLSAIVPLIIFFAFQKYFEAGLLGGSVK